MSAHALIPGISHSDLLQIFLYVLRMFTGYSSLTLIIISGYPEKYSWGILRISYNHILRKFGWDIPPESLWCILEHSGVFKSMREICARSLIFFIFFIFITTSLLKYQQNFYIPLLFATNKVKLFCSPGCFHKSNNY